MKAYPKPIIVLSFLFHLMLISKCYGLDAVDTTEQASKKWFIILPLRFTQLQNSNTMLSGIKLGRSINNQLDASISIYHSFYLTSFKAEANLSGFTKQPRLFINCMATELEYYFFKKNKMAFSTQLLMGWGFIKYDSKEQNFKSKQVNYLAIEPSLNAYLKLNNNTFIGLGIGYRPILSNKQISYSADNGAGELPISKKLPNGLNILLSLKGFL